MERGPTFDDFRKRVLITEDLEGNPQEKMFAIRSKLIEELRQYPWFVGVAPFGSRIKGYAKPLVIVDGGYDSGSDSDFTVYYDLSKAGDERNDVFDRIREAKEKVSDVIPDSIIEIHSIDLDSPAEMVQDYLRVPRVLYETPIELSPLCILADGPLVNEYRHLLGAEISKLSPADRAKVIDNIVEEVAISEKERAEEIGARLGVSKEQIIDAVEEKRPMWRKWIVETLDVEE